MRNPSGERTYSLFVLSALMIAGGVILAICFSLTNIPITSPLPFVRSEYVNRAVLTLFSLACFAIGVGLLLRWRMAWYALIACLLLAVAVPIAGMFDPLLVASFGRTFYAVAGIAQAILGVAIFLAIRPVFR